MRNINDNLIPLGVAITCTIGAVYAIIKILEPFMK
tara:strand:+ start:376 stop:480 length:105 start_codon:yes stop_codon:yes gene_type:complete